MIKENITWYHNKTDSLYCELEKYWEGGFSGMDKTGTIDENYSQE